MDTIRDILTQMNEAMAGFDGDILPFVSMLIRFLLPILGIIIIGRCARSLFREKSESEIWGQLRLPNGVIVDLNFWENAIGRARKSDVLLEFPTISRNHAALIRDDKSNWRIYDVESKCGVIVNGKKLDSDAGLPIKSGDAIELGSVKMIFTAADNTDEYEQAVYRTRPGRFYKQATTLVFLTQFQILLGLQLSLAMGEEMTSALPISFLLLIALTWGAYILTRTLKRVAFEVETMGFFLSTIGLSVVASSAPTALMQQIMFIILGVCSFFVMGWFLRDLDRVKKFRRPIAILGPVLLLATLVLGTRAFGAVRWIHIGGMSVQPSEFVKIALVFAGAATLERLFKRRNLIAFIALIGLCMGLLAIMTDFGSALIFFVAYMVIAYLRSGDFATMFLSIAGAGFAGLVALASRPHIAGRFASWGNAWNYVDTAGGYQQTRAMAAAASGGLIGVGAGNGWFHRIFAADSDLVFAMVTEELGLIIALTAMSAILVFAVFAARSSGSARSSFYVIAACATTAMLVFQMLLNVLGSMDILPFTGVTFPFVSRGGTSLLASWAMLAFIKAADTRQNASFAVKTPKRPIYAGGGNMVYATGGNDVFDYNQQYEGGGRR
ncbi:MAG: FtsW/RodA/SpoVE family cell cycle protein [Oscillospiraceae bacterium]|nr:FtsW/RodA/SpoVE family cell cycle protein [Oscillospiraceae bacterium]